MSNGSKAEDGEIRDEYDFSTARRNPYAEKARAGVRLAVIEPDIYDRFPSSEAINTALRGIMDEAERVGGAKTR